MMPSFDAAIAAGVRPSAKVATVAALLGVEQSQVRMLLRHGEIGGHTIGKRGIRIFLDTVADYQERQQIAPTQGKAVAEAKRQTRRDFNRRQQKAEASLRAAGIIK